jgi:hypothetical protein
MEILHLESQEFRGLHDTVNLNEIWSNIKPHAILV